MNKHQEALNELSRFTVQWADCSNARRVSQELVDKVPHYEKLEAKAKPMKPTPLFDNKYSDDRTLCCTACGRPIKNVWTTAEYKPNYCHYCGQALDWDKAVKDE